MTSQPQIRSPSVSSPPTCLRVHNLVGGGGGRECLERMGGGGVRRRGGEGVFRENGRRGDVRRRGGGRECLERMGGGGV